MRGAQQSIISACPGCEVTMQVYEIVVDGELSADLADSLGPIRAKRRRRRDGPQCDHGRPRTPWRASWLCSRRWASA